MHCCISGCANAKRQKKYDGVRFYYFPRDSIHMPWLRDKRQKWTEVVRKYMRSKNWQPSKNTTICNAHFVNMEKSENPQNPSYLPTIFPTGLENIYAGSVIECINRPDRGIYKYRNTCTEIHPPNPEPEPEPEPEQIQILGEFSAEKTTKPSRLCEPQFDEPQFDMTNRDRWGKLGSTELGTILTNDLGQWNILQNTEYNFSREDLIREIKRDHSYSRNPHAEAETQTDEYHAYNYLALENRLYRRNNEIENLTSQLEKVRAKFATVLSKYHNEKKLREVAEKELMNCRKELKKCDLIKKKVEEIPFLRDFTWTSSNPKITWPQDSLELAVEIKDAVGWKKYLFLRDKLHIPLPSYATISRHLANSNMNININPNRTCFIKEEIMIDEDFPLEDPLEQNIES